MIYKILVAAGVILFLLAVYFFNKSVRFIKTGERATATVIELVKSTGGKSTSYKPVFKFKTALNQEVIYRHNVSTSPPAWKIGEEAVIVYDSNNPQKAKLLTYFGSFGLSVILLALAMPLIVIGGGYFFSQSYLR